MGTYMIYSHLFQRGARGTCPGARGFDPRLMVTPIWKKILRVSFHLGVLRAKCEKFRMLARAAVHRRTHTNISNTSLMLKIVNVDVGFNCVSSF